MLMEINTITPLLPEHLQIKVFDTFYGQFILKHLNIFLMKSDGLESILTDDLNKSLLQSLKTVIYKKPQAIEILRQNYKKYLNTVCLNFQCNAMKQYESLSNGNMRIKCIVESKHNRIISDLIERQYLYSEYFNDCTDLKITYGEFMEQLMNTTLYLIPMRHILVCLLHNLLQSQIDDTEFNQYASSYLHMYYWVEDKDIFYKEFTSSIQILLLSTTTHKILLLINRIKQVLGKMNEK